MIKIIFESHSTSIDNENEVASGHADTKLSPLGEKQSIELGKRYENNLPDVVFCSDLFRSYKTGEIAFSDRGVRVLKDKRLRECDYGEYTQHPSEKVKQMKPKHIDSPFPGGESYKQCANRMKEFLKDLLKNYDGLTVMIIGHRATQYGLEHWIKGIPLEKVIPAPWKWQPGWIYNLQDIK